MLQIHLRRLLYWRSVAPAAQLPNYEIVKKQAQRLEMENFSQDLIGKVQKIQHSFIQCP
jgi:hypothetical protein